MGRAYRIRNIVRQILWLRSYVGISHQSRFAATSQRKLYLLFPKSFEERRLVHRNGRHFGKCRPTKEQIKSQILAARKLAVQRVQNSINKVVGGKRETPLPYDCSVGEQSCMQARQELAFYCSARQASGLEVTSSITVPECAPKLDFV